MKYAWVVTCNVAYLPSLRAMLGALEYYEYRGIDVHILHDDSITEDLRALKDKYSFPIITSNIESIENPGHTLYHKFIYTKYLYASDLAAGYDAVMHIDADCMILDNFMKYFEIAAKTGLFICAQFPHTSVHIDDYKIKDPDWVHCMSPLANFPCFYNPDIYADLMLEIWKSQPNEQTDSDPMRNVEMYFFNKKIYEMGLLDNVLVLPGGLWVTDNFVGHTGLYEVEIAGKRTLWNATKDRIQVIHNKWWKEGVSEAEIERSGQNALTCQNIDIMLRMFHFLEKQTAEAR